MIKRCAVASGRLVSIALLGVVVGCTSSASPVASTSPTSPAASAHTSGSVQLSGQTSAALTCSQQVLGEVDLVLALEAQGTSPDGALQAVAVAGGGDPHTWTMLPNVVSQLHLLDAHTSEVDTGYRALQAFKWSIEQCKDQLNPVLTVEQTRRLIAFMTGTDQAGLSDDISKLQKDLNELTGASQPTYTQVAAGTSEQPQTRPVSSSPASTSVASPSITTAALPSSTSGSQTSAKSTPPPAPEVRPEETMHVSAPDVATDRDPMIDGPVSAGQAVDPARFGPAGGLRLAFATPSGNINCNMFNDYPSEGYAAMCRISAHDYPATPDLSSPACGNGDTAEVGLATGSRAPATCNVAGAIGGATAELGYGQSLTIGDSDGGITCLSTKSGVKCDNTKGPGFVISNRELTVYQSAPAPGPSTADTTTASWESDRQRICQIEFIASVHTMAAEISNGDYKTFDDALGHEDPITGITNIYVNKYSTIKTSSGASNADDALTGHAIEVCKGEPDAQLTAEQLRKLKSIAPAADVSQLNRISQ